MNQNVKRIFVRKKPGFDIEARGLMHDLQVNLGISGLKGISIINRYDIEGISDAEFAKSVFTVFSEPPVDDVFYEKYNPAGGERIVAVEYLPGQYDQRADSAAQCVQLLTLGALPVVRTAKYIVLTGEISDAEFTKIENYCINPVESREASLDKPKTLADDIVSPDDVAVITGFIDMDRAELSVMREEQGFAMSDGDLEFCRDYFKDDEHRDPTFTELKVIDTYWSDHCRHTTFLTKINKIEFEGGRYSDAIKSAYERYLESRKFIHAAKSKEITLMDIATIAGKELFRRGLADDLDISDEINACSIKVDVDVDGSIEKWLVMFKNETHNHPTEIEPFGGAATCLGGAIRDPLSGRSYVYQAMRVTGSGDPRTAVKDTLPGKLPQRKITTGAASGYSAYGNQIGLATGQVTEFYDEGFVAKRMEIGAVIGAAPAANIVRETPAAGDIVILLGGRTGRDGCGGATGSSKAHTEESLAGCGAEVQKGNPPTERKMQRLLRKPEISRLIKRCNDFGAGGVSVAIGELADGLEINLDAVPKKYEGLDGTELAISESQERMAMVVAPSDADEFIAAAAVENLEATRVAVVTGSKRLRMTWRGKVITDISREFLDTNGVSQNADVFVSNPDTADDYFKKMPALADGVRKSWISNLNRLEVCGQKGLGERFDGSIGAASVLMPFGGRKQLTPEEGMAAKIPVPGGATNTATVMTFGYDPKIGKWSPFHGAMYAVLESVSKVVAIGADYKGVRLSLQEYFERLGSDPVKWGRPFSALLGAYHAQQSLGIPAIGGKDSMSGTFKDISVPPTLVSFAVVPTRADRIVSAAFKKPGNPVIGFSISRNDTEVPDFEDARRKYDHVRKLMLEGAVVSASVVKNGGIAAAVSKMCMGNGIGFEFERRMTDDELYLPDIGAIILEMDNQAFSVMGKTLDVPYVTIGHTVECSNIFVNGECISIDECVKSWTEPLEGIFPTRTEPDLTVCPAPVSARPVSFGAAKSVSGKPRVFIPVFPGTNTEYDSAAAFEKAGARVETFVIRNLTADGIRQSIDEIVNHIGRSQIIMLPGGFSAGDEPDGSGKFIATVFRNPYISEAVDVFLKKSGGLMLGICNGFQALVKLGLLPYGEIRDITHDCPTLTFNSIGRHVSRMTTIRVASTMSPWFAGAEPGAVCTVPVSHGEGRFIAPPATIADLAARGQIATQYVDFDNIPSNDIDFNPNGSMCAIEGITSPDGRILGKMGHSERMADNTAVNIPGPREQYIFTAGVGYFK